MLRKHQAEFKEIVDRIISGSPVKTVYVSVCPGGGKSLLPILAGKLIEAGKADKIIWAAPRLSLLDQGEREFINPVWRQELGHRITVRSSTNEVNPCRGLNGFCTTMQAVGLDEGILPEEFSRHRYILIIDEGHHISVGSPWEQKFQELWNLAAYRIFLSGTLERGDGERIAFLPYRMNDGCMVPELRESEDTAVIRYSRADALSEKAIIPLSFHLKDAAATWEERSGKVRGISSIDRMNEADTSKAIYTALKTEFADHLLEAGIHHWIEHRSRVPHAKCLIVCSNIEEAKRHTERLGRLGLKSYAIATSEDTPEALKAINAMKRNRLDILVAVAMVYEGLSIEAVSHIVCLTRYRSTPWIEQCIARANRIDPNAGPYETQAGYIFAPSDPLFKEIVYRIETEQMPEIKKRSESESAGNGSGESQPGLFGDRAPGGITPLSSQMTGGSEYAIGGPMFDAPLLTASEQEAALLSRIEKHIRAYSFQNRYNPKRINAEVYAYFNKSRQEMTIPELERCLEHVRRNYPMERVRGTGKRVSTKAEPIPVKWKDERLLEDRNFYSEEK